MGNFIRKSDGNGKDCLGGWLLCFGREKESDGEEESNLIWEEF